MMVLELNGKFTSVAIERVQSKVRRTFILVFFFLLCSLALMPVSASNCDNNVKFDPMEPPIGPFDYTIAEERHYIEKVERRHFTPEIQALIKGNTGSIWQDLDYTLRAYPNHHLALHTMAKLYRVGASGKEFSKEEFRRYFWHMPQDRNSAEVYLDRAIAFAPDDPAVRLIYGIHYHKLKMFDRAERYYLCAKELQPNLVEASYNLGLLYFDTKRFDEAKSFAEEAYGKGYPLKGLKNKLISAGIWK